MKKVMLVGVLAVMLAGCTTVPQAPKDAKEMAEMGEDNLLNVPVDISGFMATKMEIVSEEDKDAGLFGFGRDGDKGVITVFTDPVSGNSYDMDGQPVNEKGERILKNGYVCKVRLITSNMRIYVNMVTGDANIINSCSSSKALKQKQRNQSIIFSTAVLGAGALAVGVVGTQIDMLTDDDTL